MPVLASPVAATTTQTPTHNFYNTTEVEISTHHYFIIHASNRMDFNKESGSIATAFHQPIPPAGKSRPKRHKASKAVVSHQSLKPAAAPSNATTIQAPHGLTARKSEMHKQQQERTKLNPPAEPYLPRTMNNHVLAHVPFTSLRHPAGAFGKPTANQTASVHRAAQNEAEEQHNKRTKPNLRTRPYLPKEAKNSHSRAPALPPQALSSIPIPAVEVTKPAALMVSPLLPKKTKNRKPRRDPRIILSSSAIHTFDVNSLKADCAEEMRTKNYKFLASYNWTKDKAPTIYVPGLYNHIRQAQP